MADTFNPRHLLQVLDEHGVAFVLIGGLAATVHGSDQITRDADVCPSPAVDNLNRLSAALRALGARIRVDGIPGGLAFDHDGASLARARVWNLTTEWGDLDLSFVPSGTTGFDDLRSGAVAVDLWDRTIQVASLADIVRSKRAADRQKDRVALPVLERLLALTEE